MGEDIRVGMGEIAAAQAPAILSIIGIGSCVGVALYHNSSKTGSLAHIMLPDSSRCRPGAAMEKFADKGIPAIIDKMKAFGADPLFLQARLIGGASMFKTSSGSGAFNIGESNVAACRDYLKKERIRIVGEDVLGSRGRTMRFDLETGKISVKYVDGNILEL